MSTPPLGHVSQGQEAPGRKGLGTVQGLSPQTSILRADKGEEAVPKALERASHSVPWPPESSAPPPWLCPGPSCLGPRGRR